MKKIISFIITFILLIGLVSFSNPTEVDAKTKNISASTVKAVKKGTLPGAIGGINTKYKTLKSKSKKVKWMDADPIGMVTWKNDIYGLKSKSKNAKVQLISRSYNYTISKKSLKKAFGKSYKTSAPNSTYYKAGKYLVHVESSYGTSTIWLGTKKSFKLIPGLGYGN